MNIWARIKNGVVAELIYLPADKDPAKIFHSSIALVNVTSVSLPPAVGWGYVNGVFAPPAPKPAPMPGHLARAALSAGCRVTSASDPELNGTYPVLHSALGRMAVTAHMIALHGDAFPAGTSVVAVKDVSGALHPVKSASAYLALYKALASYALDLDQISISNAGTLPAQPVAIP